MSVSTGAPPTSTLLIEAAVNAAVANGSAASSRTGEPVLICCQLLPSSFDSLNVACPPSMSVKDCTVSVKV